MKLVCSLTSAMSITPFLKFGLFNLSGEVVMVMLSTEVAA
ncbi:hypothetical protein LINGRAHAP2_LOCUS1209 [Linum grandiflorum]